MGGNRHPIIDSVRRLLPPGSRALAALSGGADSVALLAAMVEAGVDCHAVHCNYHLRGEESDRDESHARAVAARMGVEITVVDCDVAAYRVAHGGSSVEMACREMRYDAFREVARAKSLDVIAVGHHVEDNVETVMLNLFRGSGIKGLGGMRLQRGNIVRPLLRNTRAEILDFLESRGLDYVTDSSNLTCDYRRNAIRNVILPIVREYFPAADKGLDATIGSLSAQRMLLDDFLTQKCARYVDDGVINLRELITDEPHAPQLLFELLNRPDYRGYSASTVESIIASSERSGLTFYGTDGSGYSLSYGRLVPIETVEELNLTAPWPDAFFSVEELAPEQFRPERDPDVAYFDADAISAAGPFTLRHPRVGDRLAPYGMKGTRLLSDIFAGEHIPMNERAGAPVLTDAQGRILWLPGIRASRHYAVNPATRRIIKVIYRRR